MPDEVSNQPEPVTAADITPLDMPKPDAPAPDSSTQGATAAPETQSPGPAGSTPAPAPTAAPLELDAGGVPFDPEKHARAKHGKTGRWMPRRPKRKAAAPGAAESRTLPAPSYIPPGEPPQPAAPEAEQAAATASPDHSEAAAECVARSAQFVAGIVFDAPEDCTPPAAEHAGMVRATAAYIRAKGWQFAAGSAVGLVFGAWILRTLQKPRPREKLRDWLQRTAGVRARNVTPEQDRPARSSAPASGTIIEIPANIPPLARP